MAAIQKRIRKDGSTSYRALVRLRGFPPQSATFDYLADAKNWAKEVETDIRRGKYLKTVEARKHTLAEAIDKYVEDVLPNKRTGHDKTMSLLEFWKRELGPLTLAETTPARIAEKRDNLARGKTYRERKRSPATCNRYTAALSNVFSYAVREWEWTEENPVPKLGKLTEPRGRVRVLTKEEREALLAVCQTMAEPTRGKTGRKIKPREPRLYPIVVLALSTGMRQGEILKLRWSDIDFQRGIAVLHDTKNQERRAVPITGLASAVLLKMAKVRRIDTDLVFASPRSSGARFPQKPWERALEDAGIEDFRFHDLRHSAASYLAENGATLAELAAVLGHKTLAMVKRYSHLTEQHTCGVVKRMNDAIFGDPNA